MKTRFDAPAFLRIIGSLSKNQPQTTTQLHRSTSIKQLSTLRYHLDALEGVGLITKKRSGTQNDIWLGNVPLAVARQIRKTVQYVDKLRQLQEFSDKVTQKQEECNEERGQDESGSVDVMLPAGTQTQTNIRE